ncbi:MAG: hypothetical protein ABL962_17410 [Fimbriimonadaceae bacterium]
MTHPPSVNSALVQSVDAIHRSVSYLQGYFPNPELVEVHGAETWRHKEKTALLASYLKCVRIAGTLNACLALLQVGHVQEVYALCRGVEEAGEDITFLAISKPHDKSVPKNQARLVAEFFQEEFVADSVKRFLVSSKRDRVPRKTIHAAMARSTVSHDPNRLQVAISTVHRTFSGFVHGAYGHIMDMFNGQQYRMKGLVGTPRILECEELLASYVYRAIAAVRVVTRQLGDEEIDTRLKSFGVLLEKEFDILPTPKDRTKAR